DKNALNYMSVSLLRMPNNRILLFFLRKSTNSDGSVACMPYRCFSDDEGKTWTTPERCLREQDANYLVVNNDRLIQLPDRRIAFPAAITLRVWQKDHSAFGPAVSAFCYSEDNGETWSQSPHLIYPVTGSGSRTGWQEPGIVSLDDKRILMWLRNSLGYQYQSMSYDSGNTWTAPAPNLSFRSPEAPLSMKRDPKDNSLIAVWDDHAPVWGTELHHDQNTHIPFWGTDRRPLVLARSFDNAITWTHPHIIENDPDSGFCYTAIHFFEGRTLLAYCCGSKANGHGCLQDLRIRTLE
ncbi:MAG: exo-alpha-sialidase, partial [Victivallales bacterium]|nr:exo-alpha-sialidase [Victivallales bacterium]